MFFPGYSQIPFFDFTFVVISQHSRVFPFHLWLDTDHARTNNMKQPKWENRKKNEDGTFPREHPRKIFPNSRTSHFRRRRSKPRGGIFHFSYEYLRGFGSKISSNITIPLMLWVVHKCTVGAVSSFRRFSLANFRPRSNRSNNSSWFDWLHSLMTSDFFMTSDLTISGSVR